MDYSEKIEALLTVFDDFTIRVHTTLNWVEELKCYSPVKKMIRWEVKFDGHEAHQEYSVQSEEECVEHLFNLVNWNS